MKFLRKTLELVPAIFRFLVALTTSPLILVSALAGAFFLEAAALVCVFFLLWFLLTH